MKEKPILFSGPMVRASLAGIKTNTRRTGGLEIVNENPGAWVKVTSVYLNTLGREVQELPGEALFQGPDGVGFHFPEHRTYVEVFGGAAGVLLRKERSRVEVYNDLDTQVVNFFQVLRDPAQTTEFVRLVGLTPFSRGEFDLSYEPADDPVEAARRFLVRCHFGHGTCSMDPSDSNGFRSCDIRAGKSYAKEWGGVPSAISAAADRIKGVTIENLDFRKLIPKFDTAETLFYVDPPYPMSTRSAGGKGYVYEMSDQDHRQLAWLLRKVKGHVILSGYPCSLYDELYADWRHDEKKTTANGQIGAVPRTEFLWMNFTPAEATPL